MTHTSVSHRLRSGVHAIKTGLKGFRRSETGSVTIEAAIYIPLMLFVFALIYVFFDAYRQKTVNIKAAYTISDLISRETAALDDDYIDGLQNLAQLLVRNNTPLSMRISVVRWDTGDPDLDSDDRYYVDWSVERGSHVNVWTDATIEEVADRLPNMPNQERVILVETWNDYNPLFDVGIPAFEIQNFVFSRPRFATQVAYEGMNPSDGSTHDDGVSEEIL